MQQSPQLCACVGGREWHGWLVGYSCRWAWDWALVSDCRVDALRSSVFFFSSSSSSVSDLLCLGLRSALIYFTGTLRSALPSSRVIAAAAAAAARNHGELFSDLHHVDPRRHHHLPRLSRRCAPHCRGGLLSQHQRLGIVQDVIIIITVIIVVVKHCAPHLHRRWCVLHPRAIKRALLCGHDKTQCEPPGLP